MALDLVTPPANEIISTADAKHHLRVDISDDDGYIDGLVTAVRMYLERICWSAFITQTYDLYLDDWPAASVIHLPRAPLQSVSSITYTDDDGNESTFASVDYIVDTVSKPARIVLADSATWPTGTLRNANAIVIRFVAGYGDNAEDVPAPIIHAAKLLLTDYYENREQSIVMQGATVNQLPWGVPALLRPYRFDDMRVRI